MFVFVFGCRVKGIGFRVQGIGCMVYGVWCMVKGVGCMVYGKGCRGANAKATESIEKRRRVSGVGCRAPARPGRVNREDSRSIRQSIAKTVNR